MAESSQLTPGPLSTKSSPHTCPQHGSGTPSASKSASFLDGSRKEDDWLGAHGNELIFPLDDEEEAGSESPEDFSLCEDDKGQQVHGGESTFHLASPVPYPSESSILASLSVSNSLNFPPQKSLINPQGPKPLINLVKSVSTEIEPRDSSPLKAQPLLSLVKSISTEISRLEPEVTPSKSDSKLNVNLWRQIKSKHGDSRTAPSSPNTSPSESKGSFLKLQEAKFEETKRRFSEAMQEPLNRLSKIMGDENNISPKTKPVVSSGHVHESPSGHSKGAAILETKAEGLGHERDQHGTILDRPSRKVQLEDFSHTGPKWEPSLNCQYEICSYGDVIQVVEVAQKTGGPEELRTLQPLDLLHPPKPCNAVPCKTLACIAILAYNYFILPLPPYLSGLCLGLVCGFLLSFVMVLLMVPKCSRTPYKRLRDKWSSEMLSPQTQGPSLLQGWMNEMYFYDPEIYHPSLTHSVCVTLEGTSLKLSYPKNNISRWATFGEEFVDVALVDHRHYDMRGAKVFLTPAGLARKRIWNKKYPICVLFLDHVDLDSKGSSEEELEFPVEKTSVKRRVMVSPETTLKPSFQPQERTLYLFGRTGREKEEWFRHLAKAAQGVSSPAPNNNPGFNQLSPSRKETSSESSSRGSVEDLPSAVKAKDLVVNVREKLLSDYHTYMSRLVQPTSRSSPRGSPSTNVTGSPNLKKLPGEANIPAEPHMVWVNALLGRMFWDFLREKYWADQVSNKIQKKLGRIKLPYFMNDLTLTELDMGASILQILSASSPTVDNRGLWVDMEVTYNGSLQMTLETKMNLNKLGKEATGEDGGKTDNSREGARACLSLLADSDAESSSAGSSEEEDVTTTEPSGNPGDRNPTPGVESHVGGNSTGRKILRFVDKIAKSKYFQKATENEFIRKKIEEVSNTPLLLTVEVQELTGPLTVNIPPPPTDRIWYSFRIPPRLDLKVCPKLGEREVTFIHITEWIEKQLQREFQKILVMPHMDDLILPLMHSGLESQLPHEGPQKDNPGEVGKKN